MSDHGDGSDRHRDDDHHGHDGQGGDPHGHDYHSHDGQSGDPHGHDHHAHDASAVAVAVLTVTSSRDESTDEGGTLAREAIAAAGHDVVAYDTVPDDAEAIRDRVRAAQADAVVTTGGTGLTPDDVTVDALRPLFDREMPGFGEYFRRLSHDQVGTPAMLSRATAGVVGSTVVYALPGSPDAVALGVQECVLPELDHAVGLASRD